MVGQYGRTSRYLEVFVTAVLRFRIPVLIGVFLCTALLGWQLQYLKFDTSNEGFLHEDDPYLKTYNHFREEFGRDDFLVLAIYSETLYSIETLDKLRALHEDLLNSVPFLGDITSLINVRDVRGEDNTLLVDELDQQIEEEEREGAAKESKRREPREQVELDCLEDQLVGPLFNGEKIHIG